MLAKLTRLSHKIAIQLHLVAESCTICSSHSRWPVWKLLDPPSYALLPLSYISLKYAIRKAQEDQEWLELSGTHQC
jgi:hypothetical protein